MLYVKEDLDATNNEKLNTTGPSEAVWCNILTRDGSKMTVGVCNRADTAAAEEVAIGMGNFNHETIDWVNLSSQAGEQFLDLVQNLVFSHTACGRSHAW